MKFILCITIVVSTFFCTYAQIPENYYYDTNNKSGGILKQTLHEIIDNHHSLDYSELWSAFQSTDQKADSTVWDIYSDNPTSAPSYQFSFQLSDQCGNYSAEGDCYNREHSFPQSWFGKSEYPMYSDLFQVYPTDGYVNGKRGNFPFGETESATWTSSNGSKIGTCSYKGYSGIIFEPIDIFKGDIARSMFYMATRYYQEDTDWPGSDMADGSQPKDWAINLLYKWHNEDPVSQKEIDRNNAIYKLQGNRNPFIDHPEFVTSIWEVDQPDTPIDQEVEVDLPNNHVTDFSTSFITLNWTDATGVTNPDGYLIFINENNFNQIQTPTDGVSPIEYSSCKIVKYGIEKVTFGNLKKHTTYYFKIFPYSGYGSQTDYKTDEPIPQLSQDTN